MRGDFDGLLKWPLKAKMKIALLNQQPQGLDYEFNTKLECSKPIVGDIKLFLVSTYLALSLWIPTCAEGIFTSELLVSSFRLILL